MTKKILTSISLPRLLMIALLGFVAATFFTAPASALSVEQIHKQYGLNSKDAQQLINDVRDDVQQQCSGRTSGEMSQCVSSKTGPVLQQHASRCIDNKKLDENCSQQITKDNNKEIQGPAQTNDPNGKFATGDNQYKTVNDVCGGTVDGQDESVQLSIKIGCKGKGNPIADMLFAVIRILSDGVGLVVIASITYGGIQYIGSRGDPQATALAVNRIRSSLFALILFIFGYAILNYIIPAGFIK